MLSAFFIDRPKFAIVISIVITLAGFIAINAIPVAEYPDITPPQVKVTTDDVARFGAVPGRLQQVSATTFEDDLGEPYYRGIIALDRNHVGATASQNLILPGMVVDADVSTGSKSLLRYLLKPVFRSLDGAFSER